MAVDGRAEPRFAFCGREPGESALFCCGREAVSGEPVLLPETAGVSPAEKGETIIDKDTIWRVSEIALPDHLRVKKGARLLVTASTLRFPDAKGIIVESGGTMDIRNNSFITSVEREPFPAVAPEGRNGKFVYATEPERPRAFTGAAVAGTLVVMDSTLERMSALAPEGKMPFGLRATSISLGAEKVVLNRAAIRYCGSTPRGSWTHIQGLAGDLEMRNSIVYNNPGTHGIIWVATARQVSTGNIVTAGDLGNAQCPYGLLYQNSGIISYNYVGEAADHGGYDNWGGVCHSIYLHSELRQGTVINNGSCGDIWVEGVNTIDNESISSNMGDMYHVLRGEVLGGKIWRSCGTLGNVCESSVALGGPQNIIGGAFEGLVAKGPINYMMFWPPLGKAYIPRNIGALGFKGNDVYLCHCEDAVFVDPRIDKSLTFGGRNKRVVFINPLFNTEPSFVENKKRCIWEKMYGKYVDYTETHLDDEYRPCWYAKVKVLDAEGKPVEGAVVKIANEKQPSVKPVDRFGQEREVFITGKDGATALASEWPYVWEQDKAKSEPFPLPAGEKIDFGGWMKLKANYNYEYVKGWLVLQEMNEDKNVLREHPLSLVGEKKWVMVNGRPTFPEERGWGEVKKEVTTHSHAKFGRVLLNIYGGEVDAWFDELYVRPAGTMTNLLPEPSFEEGAKGWTKPDGVLSFITDKEAKEGNHSYNLHWSFWGKDDKNVVCLPGYSLKGDGSLANYSYTIVAEKDAVAGKISGVNPSSLWHSEEPGVKMKEIIITLGKEGKYVSSQQEMEKHAPDREATAKRTVLSFEPGKIREPEYDRTTNLIPEPLALSPDIWEVKGDWKVENGVLLGKTGTLTFLPYEGSDTCFEFQMKYPAGAKNIRVDLRKTPDSIFRIEFATATAPGRITKLASNIALYNFSLPLLFSEESYLVYGWRNVLPEPDKWFGVKIEIGGGKVKVSFDHDLDGNYAQPYGELYGSGKTIPHKAYDIYGSGPNVIYSAPLTWTTDMFSFHSGYKSRGKVGISVGADKEVCFRNLRLYGSGPGAETKEINAMEKTITKSTGTDIGTIPGRNLALGVKYTYAEWRQREAAFSCMLASLGLWAGAKDPELNKLTDGKLTTQTWRSGEGVCGKGKIVFHFPALTTANYFRAHFASHKEDSINGFPDILRIEASDDGNQWQPVGETAEHITDRGNMTVGWMRVILDKPVTFRYLRLMVVSESPPQEFAYPYMDEFEVYNGEPPAKMGDIEAVPGENYGTHPMWNYVKVRLVLLEGEIERARDERQGRELFEKLAELQGEFAQTMASINGRTREEEIKQKEEVLLKKIGALEKKAQDLPLADYPFSRDTLSEFLAKRYIRAGGPVCERGPQVYPSVEARLRYHLLGGFNLVGWDYLSPTDSKYSGPLAKDMKEWTDRFGLRTFQFFSAHGGVSSKWAEDVIRRIDARKAIDGNAFAGVLYDEPVHLVKFWPPRERFFEHLRQKYNDVQLRTFGVEGWKEDDFPYKQGRPVFSPEDIEKWSDTGKFLWAEYLEFLSDRFCEGMREILGYVRTLKKGNHVCICPSNWAGSPWGNASYFRIGRLLDPRTDILSWDCYSVAHYDEKCFMSDLVRSTCNAPVIFYVGTHYGSDARTYARDHAVGLAHTQGTGVCGFNTLWPQQTCYAMSRVPGLWEAGKRVNQKAERIESYLVGARNVSEIALLCSERTMSTVQCAPEFDAHFTDRMFWQPSTPANDYLYNLVGIYEALRQNHIEAAPRFAEAMNPAELSRYKTVILADARSLADDEISAIRDWVRGGGFLIATATSSINDRWGRKQGDYALKDVFGASYVSTEGGKSVIRLASGKEVQYGDKADYLEGYNPNKVPLRRDIVRLTDGKAIGQWEDGLPAVIENRYGKGTCVFITAQRLGLCAIQTGKDPVFFDGGPGPYPSGRRHFHEGIKALLSDMVGKGLNSQGGRLPLTVENCPDYVEVVLREQPGQLLVHLTNFGAPEPQRGIRLTLTLPESMGRFRKVFCPEDGIVIDKVERETPQIINFVVPDFGVHRMVVVE